MRGNPVASLIQALHLERNRMTLLLTNHLDVEYGSDDDGPALSQPVEVCSILSTLISLAACSTTARTPLLIHHLSVEYHSDAGNLRPKPAHSLRCS